MRALKCLHASYPEVAFDLPLAALPCLRPPPALVLLNEARAGGKIGFGWRQSPRSRHIVSDTCDLALRLLKKLPFLRSERAGAFGRQHQLSFPDLRFER